MPQVGGAADAPVLSPKTHGDHPLESDNQGQPPKDIPQESPGPAKEPATQSQSAERREQELENLLRLLEEWAALQKGNRKS
jgi:hypothetical protein